MSEEVDDILTQWEKIRATDLIKVTISEEKRRKAERLDD